MVTLNITAPNYILQYHNVGCLLKIHPPSRKIFTMIFVQALDRR